MLKKENGEDRLLSRIQFMGWALVFFMGLVGGYAKFNGDNVVRDEKAKFLEYQLSQEREARLEDSKNLKENINILASSVNKLADKVDPIIKPIERITKWLDESTNGPRGK